MPPIIRPTIRVILLNDINQLLLMRIEDFDISNGKKNRIFWCTVGGGIQAEETKEQAAIREIFEETGLSVNDIELGPIVWFCEVDLMLKGKLTRLEEYFIVAKTKCKNVWLNNLTEDELQVVKKLEWFSLEDIKNCADVIFPIGLVNFLPNILRGSYPNKPIKINLG